MLQGTGSQPSTPAGKGEEGVSTAPRHGQQCKENTAPSASGKEALLPAVSRLIFEEAAELSSSNTRNCGAGKGHTVAILDYRHVASKSFSYFPYVHQVTGLKIRTNLG
jgi:hypothetical protein